MISVDGVIDRESEAKLKQCGFWCIQRGSEGNAAARS